MARSTLLLVLLTAACGHAGLADRPFTPDGATGHTWALRQLQGERVGRTDPEAVTLAFDADGWLAGTSSCNHVGGDTARQPKQQLNTPFRFGSARLGDRMQHGRTQSVCSQADRAFSSGGSR